MNDIYLKSVAEFHNMTGTINSTEINLPPKGHLRELRRNLLLEEFNEFLDGDDNDDIVDIADALGDMLYIIFGTALVYGIPLDKIFSEIHSSNMSKSCSTEEEAKKTIDEYSKKGVECIYTYNTLVEKYVILRKSDNKVLKSIYYRPANLKPILGIDSE